MDALELWFISAAKDGLEVTLMERLLHHHQAKEDLVMRMLTTQYRMHDDIMTWSSKQFYHGRLVAHPSVAAHLLKCVSWTCCSGILLFIFSSVYLGLNYCTWDSIPSWSVNSEAVPLHWVISVEDCGKSRAWHFAAHDGCQERHLFVKTATRIAEAGLWSRKVFLLRVLIINWLSFGLMKF